MSDYDFLAIDHLFAQKIYPEAPAEAALFLAYLLKLSREGHMCLFAGALVDERLKKGLTLLPESFFDKWLAKEEGRVYLRRNWECEKKFLSHFERLQGQKPEIEIAHEWLQERLRGVALNDEQKEALFKAAANTVTLITGGPGSGKTYTAANLISVFTACGIKEVAVAAPTGKATANLRAALGTLAERYTIKTIHALISRKRVDADLIVIDEASMVDAQRMCALFSCIKEGARLILLGDHNQLPPVESGSFFADLVHKGCFVSQLKSCLRTELVEILNLASCVKEGVSIPYEPMPLLSTLCERIMQSSFQVLTPLRKGPFGVDNLNSRLFNEHQKRGDTKIPIMIAENDARQGLFNGDCGVLVKQEGVAYFAGGKSVGIQLLPRYEYAYVLSVHKSQGSEYDRVMVLLPKGSEAFGREMLYTALTRAKKEVVVLAHEGVIDQIVAQVKRRSSGIS